MTSLICFLLGGVTDRTTSGARSARSSFLTRVRGLELISLRSHTIFIASPIEGCLHDLHVFIATGCGQQPTLVYKILAFDFVVVGFSRTPGPSATPGVSVNSLRSIWVESLTCKLCPPKLPPKRLCRVNTSDLLDMFFVRRRYRSNDFRGKIGSIFFSHAGPRPGTYKPEEPHHLYSVADRGMPSRPARTHCDWLWPTADSG